MANDTIIAYTMCPPPWGRGTAAGGDAKLVLMRMVGGLFEIILLL